MTILHGDCVEMMRTLDDESVDSLVSDPPYGLGKPPDIATVLRAWLDGDRYEHRGGGFMGREWDGFVPGPEVWREAFRVCKPGAHAVVFAGTRTVDVMGIALRLAGWEVRDSLQWLYGSGFPKSLNLATLDVPAEWDGWGTALKPAHEPVILCRKPLRGTVAANVTEYGTGGINVDGCRIGTPVETWPSSRSYHPEGPKPIGARVHGKGDTQQTGPVPAGRWPANVILDEEAAALLDEQTGNTSFNPAGAFASGQPAGWSGGSNNIGRAGNATREVHGFGDSGGASRFFYTAKASREERELGLDNFVAQWVDPTREEGSAGRANPRAGAGRNGKRANTHPTVKPLSLMRWLVRLVTPPGGLVLDPFTGSGTTGMACEFEGARFVGCEREAEYVAIAEARIAKARELAGRLTAEDMERAESSGVARQLGLLNLDPEAA